jgi:hypothetical protein
MSTSILGVGVDQWLTFIGIMIALGMGVLNWYDKRFPRKNLTKLEKVQLSLTENQSIDMANKRALDAEIRADKAEEREIRLENLYNTLKEEFEEWRKSQNYKISFSAQLGTNPTILSSSIYHDRRVEAQPFEGEDRRK